MQMAFVPDDFDAALDYWTKTMGAGPFFLIENVALEEMRYRGQPSDFVFTMALGYLGDMQIELIKPLNNALSIYDGQKGAGLHHVCILTDDVAKAKQMAFDSGAELLVEAKVGADGGVIYLETGGGPGTIVEVLHGGSGPDLFGMMREAARDWDGSDPVRKLG
jgi:methylmalonyl-CoA/ethylmalonyl-CoA epimerase